MIWYLGWIDKYLIPWMDWQIFVTWDGLTNMWYLGWIDKYLIPGMDWQIYDTWDGLTKAPGFFSIASSLVPWWGSSSSSSHKKTLCNGSWRIPGHKMSRISSIKSGRLTEVCQFYTQYFHSGDTIESWTDPFMLLCVVWMARVVRIAEVVLVSWLVLVSSSCVSCFWLNW